MSPELTHGNARLITHKLGDDLDLEAELEDAVSEQCQYIALDDPLLAKKAVAAIRFGNFLHKTSVLSGLACVVTAPLVHPLVLAAASFASGTTAAVYNMSWAYDPWCKYQVSRSIKALFQMNISEEYNPDSILILLERRDDSVRKGLHTTLAAVSAAIGAYYCAKNYIKRQ